MKNTHNSNTAPIHSASLTKCILIGAAIALVLISVFLTGVKNPNPEWGKYWMLKPLIVVSLAGAIGGIFYYLMDNLRYRGGWKTALAYVISFVGYVFVLWIGTVLGLNGTLWN